jgi:hypothetical protein
MHPTAWFTRKELEQPPHVLNPLAAEYTPQTEAPHTIENCERPTSFLNHLTTEFEPKEPTPSSHPHQNQSEETDTDEPEWSNTEDDIPAPSQPEQQGQNKTINKVKSNSRKSATRILTQNVRGLPEENDTKLKSIIHQMKTEQWIAACLQETWRLGTDDFHIDDYHIFFQGNSIKTNTKGCVMGGVCVILSPTFDLAHKKSGKETITIPASEGENFEGRFIGIPLTFPNTDDNEKKT